jgi:hypothetical protein
MKLFSISAIAALTASSVAQDLFETPDFNVTEALVEQGVNVSTLPELAGLSQRSSDLACSIAVSAVYSSPLFAANDF